MTDRAKLTPVDLQSLKQKGRKITMLSIYDYPLALLAERAGLDSILVGDSLAMTALGHRDTVALTMEESLHHVKAVARAARGAMVVADMPFLSYQTSERDAILNAGRFLKEGMADAVKVEGGAAMAPTLGAIHRAGIPVMGHVGLTPQSAAQLGGLKVQGKDVAGARRLVEDALALEAAGAFAVILECVPDEVARIVTTRLRVPTISYGAGVHCDGQGLVSADILGLFDRFTPKFAKRYADLGATILEVFETYRDEVVAGSFPDDAHSYHINAEELAALQEALSREGGA
ncbi:MAG: 3-methyl-2-oxobutanoate hydroxymethyltransferase [Proteobacteria bacterium]|nr:3-methyl-2-oxobutanoate hydroxymethyltransferase [Pseudomonadota bacterium]